jgi:KDO2-lipid IV(A) lauroyltransferase
MKFLSYIIFRLFYALLAITPFRVLYLLSNFAAFILQYVIAYRKKVIKDNIQRSLPSLNEQERQTIIKKTYLNLSDLLLESIKGLSMSKKELARRHKFINPELLQNCFENHQSIILLTGHFNNWEWGIFSFNYYLPFKIIGIYKPLSNKYIDEFLKNKRAKAGTILADLNLTRSYFEEFVPKTSLFYMAADQSPSNLKRARWLTFLHQDTPSIHGPEKYAKRYGLPVVYAHIARVKRGFYEVKLEWICEDKMSCMESDITLSYHQILESDIIMNPESWIWSHRRWKHSHKKNMFEVKE